LVEVAPAVLEPTHERQDIAAVPRGRPDLGGVVDIHSSPWVVVLGIGPGGGHVDPAHRVAAIWEGTEKMIRRCSEPAGVAAVAPEGLRIGSFRG
jgi:hypothetical protein